MEAKEGDWASIEFISFFLYVFPHSYDCIFSFHELI